MKNFKILILASSQSNIGQILTQVKKSGIPFREFIALNRVEYIRALTEFMPDLIISGYSLTDITLMEALKIKNIKAPDTKFIAVIKNLKGDAIIEIMKAGANDCIMKSNISRLKRSVSEMLNKRLVYKRKKGVGKNLEITKIIFDSLLNCSPVYIFIKNSRSEILRLSRNFSEIINMPVEEAIGKNIKELFPEPVAEKILKEDKKIIRKKILIRDTEKINGKIYETTKFSVEVEGIGTCIAGFIVDITDRVKAREELDLERVLLKKLINSLPDLINIKDSEGKYIMNNLTHLKSIGIEDPGMVIGKTPYDFFSVEEASEYIRDDKYVLATGIPIINKEECTIQKDTMRKHWYLTSKIPITDSKGQLAYLLTVSHDITERKKTQEIIAGERMLLRTLIDNHPDYIYIKDREGRKIIANKADVENIGYKSEYEILGKTDIELFSGETGRRGYEDDMAVITRGVRIINKEEDFTDSSGNKKWILTTKVPLFDSEGKITGLVGIGRNITRIKEASLEIEKARKKAEESNKFKTAFLSNITHEIRTPMNSIVGFATLLSEQCPDEETRKSYIDVIKQSSNQLLRIVNDIIEVSNLEAGITKLLYDEVDLNKIMANLFIQYQVKAREKEIEFVFQPGLTDDKSTIRTDPAKLVQIITNLLENAFKYIEKGKIDFGYLAEKNYIRFYVSDTGPGIPKEYHARIFERFFRINSPFIGQKEGTGLGLAITKGYVELLGGKIWLSSIPGKGTTFYFTIPSRLPESERQKTGTVPSSGKSILIADDDLNNFQFINIFLSKHGFATIHASNGKEAVEIIKSGEKVDLVIMDMKMPVMDGYEATKIIKKLKPFVPVIAVTAYAMNEDREKSIEAGCDEYLSKPVTTDLLITTVNKFI
ncbi:MAG: PAS domain-containing protein [Bacteroidales bacterium]